MDLMIDEDKIFLAYFDLAGLLRLNSLEISNELKIQFSDQIFESVKFGSRLQQSIKLMALNSQYNLILLGGYDKMMHVYSFSVQGPKN